MKIGPRPGSWASKCENNMKIISNKDKSNKDKSRDSVKSTYFHMYFILCSYDFHILCPWDSGPGLKAAARAQPGPVPPPLEGPGPGAGPQSMKQI